MKILSIDWDYFIDASSLVRFEKFHDGLETMGRVNEIIWSGRYASYPELKDLGIRKKEYDYLFSRMGRIFRNAGSIYIEDSHKWLGDIVCSSDKLVELYNIDFHSDVYDSIVTMDCGNWLRYADMCSGGEGSIYTWVLWEGESDRGEWDRWNSVGKKESLGSIGDIEGLCSWWDVVYICRSSTWSPPHLDSYFRELVMEGIMGKDSIDGIFASKDILLERSIDNSYVKHLGKNF